MKNIYFSIPVSIFKEGDDFVAYSPVLDLSTCASSIERAHKMFEESTEIFFEELDRKGTMNDVLTSLGWKKTDSNWFPPTEISHQTKKFSLALKA
ncbi:MAG: type II toxin-antitoxin system HicB family antitoxin [Candidatus Berkelbacteria bacterium]|nr:type II toxin-antitoxin system HicB family antitoxin [Candidatus Berkelbacteria bacterium]